MKWRHSFICLLFAFLFSPANPAGSVPAEVEDVSNRAYLPAVLKEINNAKESIYASFISLI